MRLSDIDLSSADAARARVACRGKVRYSSKAAAEAEARRLHEKYGDDYEDYPCHLCRGHHVGHRSGGRNRRRTDADGRQG